MDGDQDPQMILSVVRRLHRDQGDTELHTILRASRFLDLQDATQLITNLFQSHGTQSVNTPNSEGLTVQQMCGNDSNFEIPPEIKAVVLDPLGESKTTAVMALLTSLEKKENKKASPPTAPEATTPTLPVPVVGQHNVALPPSVPSPQATNAAAAPPPQPTQTPATTTTTTTPASPTFPGEIHAGWLTIGETKGTPASEYWFRLVQDQQQHRLTWWANPDAAHSKGSVHVPTISNIVLPGVGAADNCVLQLVHSAKNIHLLASSPVAARKWSQVIQKAVFEGGAPPPLMIDHLQDVFNLMRQSNLNEESLGDDLQQYLTEHGDKGFHCTAVNDSLTGENLLEQAISHGLLDIAEILLSHSIGTTNNAQHMQQLRTLNAQGLNIFHLVCSRSTAAALQGLIDLVTSFHAAENILESLAVANRRGENCIHIAASAGNADVLELLVELGVDAYALDLKKRTALHACCAYRHRLDQNNTTHGSVEGGAQRQLDCLHFLCEVVPDVMDWGDDAGATAMHLAADQGDDKVVLALLQTAADPNVCDSQDRTPHSIAVRANHARCAGIIEQYGGGNVQQQPPPQVLQQQHHQVTATMSPYTQPPPPQPPHPWVQYMDESSGYPYWYNTATGESAWELPAPSPTSFRAATPPPHVAPASTTIRRSSPSSPVGTQVRYDGPPIRHTTSHGSPSASAWRYDRSGNTPPPTGRAFAGGGYYHKQSPVSAAGSSSMSDSSDDEMRMAAQRQAVQMSAAASATPRRDHAPRANAPPRARSPQSHRSPTGSPLASPRGSRLVGSGGFGHGSSGSSGRVSPLISPRGGNGSSRSTGSSGGRRLSPGSLALLPVDTGLANFQSRGRIAAEIAAHTPSPKFSKSPRSPMSPRSPRSPKPPQPPPGRSPLSSEGSPSLSSGPSPASSPTARLAYALSPMGDPTQGKALIEERKQARAARRKLQKALKKNQQVGTNKKG